MYYMSTLLCAQDGEGTTQGNSLTSWSLTASESKEKSKVNSVVYFSKKHSWISQEGFKSTLAHLFIFLLFYFKRNFYLLMREMHHHHARVLPIHASSYEHFYGIQEGLMSYKCDLAKH